MAEAGRVIHAQVKQLIDYIEDLRVLEKDLVWSLRELRKTPDWEERIEENLNKGISLLYDELKKVRTDITKCLSALVSVDDDVYKIF